MQQCNDRESDRLIIIAYPIKLQLILYVHKIKHVQPHGHKASASCYACMHKDYI